MCSCAAKTAESHQSSWLGACSALRVIVSVDQKKLGCTGHMLSRRYGSAHLDLQEVFKQCDTIGDWRAPVSKNITAEIK